MRWRDTNSVRINLSGASVSGAPCFGQWSARFASNTVRLFRWWIIHAAPRDDRGRACERKEVVTVNDAIWALCDEARTIHKMFVLGDAEKLAYRRVRSAKWYGILLWRPRSCGSNGPKDARQRESERASSRERKWVIRPSETAKRGDVFVPKRFHACIGMNELEHEWIVSFFFISSVASSFIHSLHQIIAAAHSNIRGRSIVLVAHGDDIKHIPTLRTHTHKVFAEHTWLKYASGASRNDGNSRRSHKERVLSEMYTCHSHIGWHLPFCDFRYCLLFRLAFVVAHIHTMLVSLSSFCARDVYLRTTFGPYFIHLWATEGQRISHSVRK